MDYTSRRVKHFEFLDLKEKEYAFCYQAKDAKLVDKIISKFREAAKGLGMNFSGDPLYIEVPRGKDINTCLESDLRSDDASKVKIVFVVIDRETTHPKLKKTLD